MRVSVITASLLLVVAAAACDAAEAPGSERYRVRVVESHAAAVQPRLQLEITDAKDGRAHLLAIAPEVESVRELMVGEDRLLALGKLQRSAGDAVIVADLAAATIEKTLWCINPVVSPDRTRVAFETFIPRFPPQGQLRPSVSVALVDKPGVPVFEVYPGSEEAPGDEQRKHSPVSPILWAEDGQALYFFDKLSAWGSWQDYEISLVTIRLSDGASKVERVVRAVDPMDFVKPGTEKERVRFYVEELRWGDLERIEAVLYPQAYWAERVIGFQTIRSSEDESSSTKAGGPGLDSVS